MSLCKAKGNYPDWKALNTIIRVDSKRETKNEIDYSTRYYISSVTESASQFAKRIRNYWGYK